MKNKFLIILSFLVLAISITGCGKDPELTKFRKELDSFFATLADLDNSINTIDPESITATTELLGYLDQVDEQFKILAAISVPDKFSYLDPLMDEASSYMSEAVASYHEAYSNNSYNEYTAAYAYENYSRAYKRVQYVITVLHGDMPQETPQESGDTGEPEES